MKIIRKIGRAFGYCLRCGAHTEGSAYCMACALRR